MFHRQNAPLAADCGVCALPFAVHVACMASGYDGLCNC